MHGYWSFDVPSDTPGGGATLVLFVSAVDPTETDVVAHLRDRLQAESMRDRLLFIAPRSIGGRVDEIIQPESFRDHFRGSFFQQGDDWIELAVFDEQGAVVNRRTDAPLTDDRLRRIRHAGMLAIIRIGQVELAGSPSHHFELPNGRHASRFLRIGGAMADGAAVDFMAFCCMRLIPPDTRHVYCDTGTIAPVVHAMNALRARISTEHPPATVDSFGSYGGIHTFPFRTTEHSRVLISISTTGGLERVLSEAPNHFPTDRIIMLFALHREADPLRTVCNLQRTPENPGGLELIPAVERSTCEMCGRGSVAIPLFGDQFLPHPQPPKAVEPTDGDAPSWFQGFYDEVVGTGLVRINFSAGRESAASKEIFFDLEWLFSDGRLESSRFASRFRWLASQGVPLRTRRIVHLDNPACAAMARWIRSSLGEEGSRIEVVAFSALSNGTVAITVADGATVVVASAVASGRSLLDVSRFLRNLQPNGAVTFLIGFARMPSDRALRELRSNLTYGERPGDRGWCVGRAVHCPLAGPDSRTDWDQERDLLASLIGNIDDATLATRIQERIKVLDSAGTAESRGLQQNVFWPNLTGERLQIRSGFAFFPDASDRNASQADVYFAVASVLHHLRRPDGPLAPNALLHRVLSPHCFDRFNDGVIQASFLRAAWPIELDYSDSDQLSREMADVIRHVLGHIDTQAGEAAREFVLALALGQLRLRAADLDALRSKFSVDQRDPVIRAIWTRVPPTIPLDPDG
jgi:hypothetical protein